MAHDLNRLRQLVHRVVRLPFCRLKRLLRAGNAQGEEVLGCAEKGKERPETRSGVPEGHPRVLRAEGVASRVPGYGGDVCLPSPGRAERELVQGGEEDGRAGKGRGAAGAGSDGGEAGELSGVQNVSMRTRTEIGVDARR